MCRRNYFMSERTQSDLAARIRKIRLDNHLTQQDVAKALDATPGYICNVENGRTAMSLRMLAYFATLTHTTIDSLVGSLDSNYAPTALDNELMELISKLTVEEKKKLITTIKLWKE